MSVHLGGLRQRTSGKAETRRQWVSPILCRLTAILPDRCRRFQSRCSSILRRFPSGLLPRSEALAQDICRHSERQARCGNPDLQSAFADRRVHGDLPACLSKIPRETNGRPDKSCDLPPSRRATCVLSDRSDVQCRLQPGQRVSGVGIGINIPAGAAFKQMVSPQQKRIRKLTSLAPLVEPPRASLTFCRMSRGTIVRCCPTAFCVFKQSLEFGCTPQAWMAPQLTILDRFDRLAALEPAPLSAGRVSTMDQVY